MTYCFSLATCGLTVTVVGLIRENYGYEDRKDKIFNMYYRATSSSQGAGLGLFIVKELMPLPGRESGLTSKLDEGTTFTLNL